jgi:DNA-binding transcriptional ArsR family regulator
MSPHVADAAGARPGDLSAAVPIFAALGDETRLGLVVRLRDDGPLSISRLTDGVAVTRQAVTKHLHVLELAGLAREQRHGRESVWELRRESFDRARACLDRLSAEWDDALGRLKSFVEGPPGAYRTGRRVLKKSPGRPGRKG